MTCLRLPPPAEIIAGPTSISTFPFLALLPELQFGIALRADPLTATMLCYTSSGCLGALGRVRRPTSELFVVAVGLGRAALFELLLLAFTPVAFPLLSRDQANAYMGLSACIREAATQGDLPLLQRLLELSNDEEDATLALYKAAAARQGHVGRALGLTGDQPIHLENHIRGAAASGDPAFLEQALLACGQTKEEYADQIVQEALAVGSVEVESCSPLPL